MPKTPKIALTIRDFEARLERLGPTDRLVVMNETTTRAIWARQREGGGKTTIILNFEATLDQMNAALANLAAKANPKPSIDLS